MWKVREEIWWRSLVEGNPGLRRRGSGKVSGLGGFFERLRAVGAMASDAECPWMGMRAHRRAWKEVWTTWSSYLALKWASWVLRTASRAGLTLEKIRLFCLTSPPLRRGPARESRSVMLAERGIAQLVLQPCWRSGQGSFRRTREGHRMRIG